jgi:hypothetical protein
MGAPCSFSFASRATAGVCCVRSAPDGHFIAPILGDLREIAEQCFIAIRRGVVEVERS